MGNKSANTTYYLTAMGILTVVICLSWGANSWANFRNYGTLNNILISQTKILPVETYENLLAKWIETPLKDINLGDVRKALESHPYVWVSRVARKYPETLQVQLAERIPLGMINLEEPVLIDIMGIVLPIDMDAKIDMIPVLSNFNPASELYPIGKPALSTKVIEARKILYSIWDNYNPLYVNLSEIRLNIEDEFELILAEHPTKVILGTKNINHKLMVLKEFEISLKQKKLTDYRLIDLRYKNQIVTRERRA